MRLRFGCPCWRDSASSPAHRSQPAASITDNWLVTISNCLDVTASPVSDRFSDLAHANPLFRTGPVMGYPPAAVSGIGGGRSALPLVGDIPSDMVAVLIINFPYRSDSRGALSCCRCARRRRGPALRCQDAPLDQFPLALRKTDHPIVAARTDRVGNLF